MQMDLTQSNFCTKYVMKSEYYLENYGDSSAICAQ
jgi:hypothetical protein